MQYQNISKYSCNFMHDSDYDAMRFSNSYLLPCTLWVRLRRPDSFDPGRHFQRRCSVLLLVTSWDFAWLCHICRKYVFASVSGARVAATTSGDVCRAKNHYEKMTTMTMAWLPSLISWYDGRIKSVYDIYYNLKAALWALHVSKISV